MNPSTTRLRSLRRGRAIHLLDIENLTCTPLPTTGAVEEVMAIYRSLVPIGPMDQFVVAVNHNALVAVGVALRGAQLLARSGHNGADEALTEAARADRIDLRFERVVIGSGDGYFADLAAWLVGHGLHVTVVSQPGHLSRHLQATVPDIVHLRSPAQQAA